MQDNKNHSLAEPKEPELNVGNILIKEKASPELVPVGNDFYEKASALIHELEEEKNKTDTDDPKYVFIADRLENTKAGLKSILVSRMVKIVNEASSQVAKKHKKKEQSSMTKEESELYNALLDLLTSWKKKRLEQLRGIKKESGQKQQALKEVPKAGLNDYIVVRLLKDIPTFLGADKRNYTLAKEDVATLPAMNAQALIAKKAAVEIGF